MASTLNATKEREWATRGAPGCDQVVRETANVLLLGDRINLSADQSGAPYGWGTVVQVSGEVVTVHRPYVHVSDFCTTGKLISYLGQETVKLPRHAPERVYSVVFRNEIPR